MERIEMIPDGTDEAVSFFVLAQTRLSGREYLLVTDQEEGDGQALILRKDSAGTQTEDLYTIVDDDDELSGVAVLFRDELQDMGISLE